ncbi:hypothetical protein HAX54_005138 [Datura stramonium]|uniref:BURP domain-containing protein n=1 Tax=Datura stramonium TaxID=4076 RepID=A0ABS8RVN1_DATST|nr:hypothetical protein [Datura stramonium]
MKSQFLYSLSFFWLAFVVSHAAISPELYWKEKLPNTQMPKVIKDFLLHTDHNTNSDQRVYRSRHQYGMWPWRHDATEDEVRKLKQDSNHYFYKPYFLEKDLKKGNVINFPSLKNENEAPFLPRESTIPFSSKKISEILNYFSIDSNSKDAQTIKDTIKLCEEPELQHKEKKLCVTSLESMVDFILSQLGTNNILAMTTEVQGETHGILQKYTFEEVQQIADGDNMVCHKTNYAYAVHYCHVGGSTKTFMVSMVGVDGTRVKAISVCHKDTSFWTPKGLPFVLLNVKPGTTPICHFLPTDQIVFVPSKEAAN